jgi:glycosyltransferase involved in cell wall biosynthesis
MIQSRARRKSGPLRVLQVIPGIASRYGGPSQAIFRMCEALEAEGADVLLVTTDADGSSRLQVALGTPIMYNGVRTLFFARQYSEAFKYSYQLARWLGSNVNGFDVVAIHAVFSHSSLAAARACQRSGVPYVVRPLGSLSGWSMSQKPMRKRLFWRLGVKGMLEGTAAIHYTSQEEMRDARVVLPNIRAEVIPLGIDSVVSQASRVSGSLEGPYVLALCRIHPVKCLDLLIDAFLTSAARIDGSNWRLVIAGDGDPEYLARLKAIVAARHAEHTVVFRGWLSGKDKSNTLSAAALVALTSRHENFGLSAAEALAFGVPVLVSRNVGLAEQIEEAGAGWATALDRDAIAGALIGAMTSDGERDRRGQAARFLAKTFTWDTIGKQLYNLYASTTGVEARQACWSEISG